jgi:acyl-CoA oxidase
MYNGKISSLTLKQLLKIARTVRAGFAPTNDTSTIFHYFHSRAEVGCAFDILGNDADIVNAFAWRSSFMSFNLLDKRDTEKMPWNDLLVDMYRLSKAHSQYMMIKNFYDMLNSQETKEQLDEATLDVMWKLFRLYSLNTLESEASEFYTSAAVTVKQVMLTRQTAVMKLLKEIRPHAVRLVDAWAFPDWQLDSALGRSDGKVYEDMFRRASELNPLNEITVDPYPESPTIFRSLGALKSKL